MQKYHLTNRPDREISDQSKIMEILRHGKFVVISMCHDNEPYIVTLSYGFDAVNNSLYFHCSPHGLKLDFIRQNPLVCATVIEDGGYVKNECAHNYKSVVFWGNMSIVESLEEKKYGMGILLDQLEDDPQVIKEKLVNSDGSYSQMDILKLVITQIHAKAGK